MRVELLDFMGDDLAVVNAARVSFDKESDWEREQNWDGKYKISLTEKDEKLIRYLAEHNHWTPFAHATVKFRVTIPIYVARQLAKHQVGGVVNEISRRYVSYTPVLDVPTAWRKSAKNVKQGSSNELVQMTPECQKRIHDTMEACLKLYNDLLCLGVCPEQARVVLPLCSETTWVWTGSLVFFARVCRLRLDPHAQKETRDVAEEFAKHMAELFPVSWAALMDN